MRGLVFSFLLLSPLAWGKNSILKQQTQHRMNHSCAETQSCSLRGVTLQIRDLKADYGDGNPSLGTTIRFRYRTRRIADLEKYAVVQFIRGCTFFSQRLPDGQIVKAVAQTRDFFGETTAFHHPRWVVDSQDTDPMYRNAIPIEFSEYQRHAMYRSNSQRGSFNPSTARYFSQGAYFPELYVDDEPVSVSRESDRERNVSLEFKTCVFKTADIPVVASPTQMRARDALLCLQWDSKWIYNYSLAAYERKRSAIDPICLAPLE